MSVKNLYIVLYLFLLVFNQACTHSLMPVQDSHSLVSIRDSIISNVLSQKTTKTKLVAVDSILQIRNKSYWKSLDICR